MTLTTGLSAAAARRGGINRSRNETMSDRWKMDFMDETFSAIRQNKQALSGRGLAAARGQSWAVANKSAGWNTVVCGARSLGHWTRALPFHSESIVGRACAV